MAYYHEDLFNLFEQADAGEAFNAILKHIQSSMCCVAKKNLD
jgi:hypothetical protein